jgi:hypothetical protein
MTGYCRLRIMGITGFDARSEMGTEGGNQKAASLTEDQYDCEDSGCEKLLMHSNEDYIDQKLSQARRNITHARSGFQAVL